MHQNPLFEGVETEFGVVGCSPQIQRVLRIIRKLEKDTSPVLITGESGVGKELVARALHEVSPLADKPFVPVDAATLVGSLTESELFGHVRGAFTGAVEHHRGLVRAADGGTLFLDEIGELNPEVQAKLLRLLQEQEIRPVGTAYPIKVNVRVLAATNRNLAGATQAGDFREDLFYRLRVISIRVPPLRERKSDIPLLARHFMGKHAIHSVRLSDAVMDRFLEYDWPGNIRELENAIRAMVALKSSPVLGLGDLPSNVRRPAGEPEEPTGDEGILPLQEIERRHILKALRLTNGDMTTAARFLGIGKTTLYRKLKQYRTNASDENDPQQRLFL